MRRSRLTPSIATAALLMAALAPTAASADVVGAVAGLADADLIQVEAVALPEGCGDESETVLGVDTACDFGLAGVVIGDSEAAVDSAGGLTSGAVTDLTAFGHASNLDLDLLTVGGTVGTVSADLLVSSDATQPGGDQTDADQLLALPDNPLLGLQLATTDATAFDVGGGNTSCPDLRDGRATLASGRNELTGLRVAPNALGDGADLVGTVNPDGVSYADSRIELVDALVGGADDGTFGVEATATVQLAPVALLGGAIVVEVAQPALVASHDGDTMTVSYETPVVTVNGDPVIDGETVEFLDMLDVPLNPVVELTVGIADASDITTTDGVATLSGVVTLDLVVGGVLGIASISVGDLSVAATAPTGGVTLENCNTSTDDPLADVRKDVSSRQVAPGSTFEYVLTVPNRGPCTLTDLVITDTITGPAGFEVLDTQPSGTVDGGVITWTLPTLEPDAVATFVVTVRVPASASSGETFDDVLSVTADCEGTPVTTSVPLDDLPEVAAPTAPTCDVSGSVKGSTHLEVKPGQSFGYLVHVVNGGNTACGPITVTDTLPSAVTFVSCTGGCTNSGGTLTWSLDGLEAGASQSFSVTVTAPDADADLTNVAVIATGGGEVSVTTDGPDVTDRSVPAPASFGGFPTVDSGELANTGGGAGLLAGLALAAAAVTRRRR